MNNSAFECRGNCSATVHTEYNKVGTLTVDAWAGCYIWYSEEGTGRDRSPPRPLLAVPKVTAHPSTASVPVTVLLYNGPCSAVLMCPLNG